MEKRKKTEPEELLAAIAELRSQAVRRGLLLERRGSDGQVYLALTSEGRRALRSSPTFSPSMNQMRRPSG